MRVQRIQHSPFPQVADITTTNLVFTKAELSTIKRACQLLKDAEDQVEAHLQKEYDTNESLGGIDPGLRWLFHGYEVEEMLDACHPLNGIQIC